jgi:hypothetical protein
MPFPSRRARIAACALAGAGVLAGAALAHAAGAPVRSSVGELSFRHPAIWQVQGFADVQGWTPAGTRVVAHVSPLALRDPCRPVPQGVACGYPVRRLPRGGVLVTWTAEGVRPFGGLARLRGGRSLSIGGHPARVKVSRPGSCAAIGADTTIEGVMRAGPSAEAAFYGFTACLRGPGLVRAAAQAQAMLRSAVIATGPAPAG